MWIWVFYFIDEKILREWELFENLNVEELSIIFVIDLFFKIFCYDKFFFFI